MIAVYRSYLENHKTSLTAEEMHPFISLRLEWRFTEFSRRTVPC